MKKNLLHTRNYFFGSVLIKATGFISIPFFTNFLSIEEFGLMSLYLSCISFLTTLFSIGILGAIKRYYFEKNNDFDSFLFSNIVFLIIVDIILVLLCVFFIDNIANFFKLSRYILEYTLIVSFFAVFIKMYLDFLQIREYSAKHNVFDFIKTILVLMLSIIFILLMDNNTFIGKIYADVIVYFCFFVYVMYIFSKFIKYNFHFSYIKYSLLFGLPILPSMFSSFILNFSDRFMINLYSDVSDVGFYSLAFSVAMILQVVILAISKSWQPVFYKSLTNKNYEVLNKLFHTNTKIVLSSALFIIFFTNELIVVLSNDTYLEAKEVVLYLVFGFNFYYLYVIYGQYTTFAKKTYYNSIFMFIVAFINILLNYYLIPIYGYKVSAITTMLSYLIMFLLFYYNAKYVLKFQTVNLLISLRLHLAYILIILSLIIINSISLDYLYILAFKIFMLLLFIGYNFSTFFLTKYRTILN